GGFVEKAEDADILFHAGIPVWLVRAAADCANARVDKVANVITEDPSQRIKLHTGYLLNCADEEPSHDLIYIGLANKTERYSAMAAYIRLQFQGPSLFGSSNPLRVSSDRGTRWRGTKMAMARESTCKSGSEY
ncbi:hypothetical protein BDP27DRAFT_1212498, partial [Rhodocollybia butyracea]